MYYELPRTAQPNKTEVTLLASLLKDKSPTKPKKKRPSGTKNNRGQKKPEGPRRLQEQQKEHQWQRQPANTRYLLKRLGYEARD